jgi:hypothetical protein
MAAVSTGCSMVELIVTMGTPPIDARISIEASIRRTSSPLKIFRVP